MSPRDYLYSLEQLGIKLGLEQIRALLEALGQPDRAFPSLIIAGTNGKGSVTAMVERALRAAGYRTGRYTSPHLVNLEERFTIDGADIDARTLDDVAGRIQAAARTLPHPPSFFEATTAVALEAFREAAVGVAILEVGLGGRLDATNVVDALAVAITAVDLDHQAYLGDTIAAIAAEKAGVIKPGRLAVLAENRPAVRNVVSEVAHHAGARLVYAPDGVAVEAPLAGRVTHATIRTPMAAYVDVRLGLAGRHQVPNAVAAVRLLEELHDAGTLRVSPAAVREGLECVEWPGRLEWRRWKDVEILLDGAHNPGGARALAAYVAEAIGHPVPLVVGAMKDKALPELVGALAPIASSVVATAASSPRAAAPDALAAEFRRVAPAVPIASVLPPMDALALAAGRGAPVVVAGSLYLVGEIRANLP